MNIYLLIQFEYGQKSRKEITCMQTSFMPCNSSPQGLRFRLKRLLKNNHVISENVG